MSMYVLFLCLRPCFVSFAGAKVRRFFKLANFLTSFFEVFLNYFLSGWFSRGVLLREWEVRAARASVGVMGIMGIMRIMG